MPWVALTVEVDRAAAEALSEALIAAGAQSVWLERGSVCALIDPRQDPGVLVAAAAHAAGMDAPTFSEHTVEDRDWVRATQAQFEPLEIGERLWTGASWHLPPAGRVAVRIDPGLAFGTGAHATTKLVLAFLERTIRGGERVLDYGCGSGILAIAAAKLGAAHVDAVDIDPEAVATARANAAVNAVALAPTLPDALRAGHYDIVVANILAQPLIVLAPLLAQRGASIALSGILETQAEEVIRAYAPWHDLKVEASEEGWALLVGERR